MIATLILEITPAARPGQGMRGPVSEGQFEEALRLAEMPATSGSEADAAARNPGPAETADEEPDLLDEGLVEAAAESEDAPNEPGDADAVLGDMAGAGAEAPINPHVLSFADEAAAQPPAVEPEEGAGDEPAVSAPQVGSPADLDNLPATILTGLSGLAPIEGPEAQDASIDGAEGAFTAAGNAVAPALAGLDPEQAKRPGHAAVAAQPAISSSAVSDPMQKVHSADEDHDGADGVIRVLREGKSGREPDAPRADASPMPEGRQPALAIKEGPGTASQTSPAPDRPAIEVQDRLIASAAGPADTLAAPQRPASPLVRNVAAQLANLPLEDGYLKLQLKPQGMGLIEVELIRDMAGRQEIAIRVQNPMVLEALRAERGAMLELLAAHGHSDGLQLDLFQKGSSKGRGERDEAAPAQGALASTASGEENCAPQGARQLSMNPTDMVI